MKFEQIITLKRNNFEIKVPVVTGDEPVDVAEAKEVKKAGGMDLAAYPWDQCIADQTEKYGDEETAKKVCGAIKAMYGRKEDMDITPNPCYDGYEPIGLKDDGSPNCVPKKVEQSKQDFVIPTPETGESEQDYVSRCMKEIGGEYDTQEQALAVCYSQLEKP
jgi:hypothetical protein